MLEKMGETCLPGRVQQPRQQVRLFATGHKVALLQLGSELFLGHIVWVLVGVYRGRDN